jgi:hypothetical protein
VSRNADKNRNAGGMEMESFYVVLSISIIEMVDALPVNVDSSNAFPGLLVSNRK